MAIGNCLGAGLLCGRPTCLPARRPSGLGFSPPWLLAYLIKSPVVLAWTQLFVALIAGMGMYYFCRRILGLGPWPSVIAAWCYPVTGSYVLWVGQWIPAVMCGLPWSLAAVDRAIRAPRGWGGPAVGIVTTLLLLGGAPDIAGQVLMVSGLYALWCILDEYRSRAFSLKGLRVLGALTLAWILGFACSMWLMVPAKDYATTGSRMIHRSAGAEERPPVGLAALPQIVLPDMYGSTVHGSFRIGALSLQESSAMAYAGSVSCLVLAPLAWFSFKRRSVIAMLSFLALFSLSWTLGFPLILPLLRLPILNMMSHNRLVFVTSFAFIALGAIGLEVLLRGEVQRRWWFGIPAILLAVLCGWCMYRSSNLPEPVASQLEAAVQKAPVGYIDEPTDVAEIQENFRTTYAVNAAFCGAGAAIWCFLMLGSTTAGWLAPALTALLCVQLIYFGYGFAAQTSPELYYPKLPIMERIAAGPPGRIIGFNCFPANLAQAVRLPDVRGYDGVDPSAMVELLLTAQNLPAQNMPYAATQYMSPVIFNDPKTGLPRIPPVLDMLNVRYVIFRGTPPPEVKPSFVDTDYWVLVNDRAMPRAFVPRRVHVVADAKVRLYAMTRAEFDPSDIAYVEQPIQLSHDSRRYGGDCPRSLSSPHSSGADANVGAGRAGGPLGCRLARVCKRRRGPDFTCQPRSSRRSGGSRHQHDSLRVLACRLLPRTRHHCGRRNLPFDLGVRYHLQRTPGLSYARLIEAARFQWSACSCRLSALTSQPSLPIDG